MNTLGKIAIIANPRSQSGAGTHAAQYVFSQLTTMFPEQTVQLFLTEYAMHATKIAAELPSLFSTIIVVGGDGAIHEVVNGIMQRPRSERPLVGLIPIGSGNDYAATIGMSENIDRAIQQIRTSHIKHADIGKVNNSYFVETLSFGLDAAIALDTMERRKKSGTSGTRLYLESGIDQLLHHLDIMHYRAQLQGVTTSPYKTNRQSTHTQSSYTLIDERADSTKTNQGTSLLRSQVITGESFIFAVQLGQTYGGHFKICPHASIDDGYFDICLAHPPLNTATALSVFLLAKGGHHTKFSRFEFHRAQNIHVRFDQEPPAQMDGEKLTGTDFVIESIPAELKVIVGK